MLTVTLAVFHCTVWPWGEFGPLLAALCLDTPKVLTASGCNLTSKFLNGSIKGGLSFNCSILFV